jgi:hypothetical protein
MVAVPVTEVPPATLVELRVIEDSTTGRTVRDADFVPPGIVAEIVTLC